MTIIHPLISIIIPIYNVEQYLPRCLNSILKQTYSKLEIICVNDDSPDHCSEILEEYKLIDSRIHVISRLTRGGVSAARNTGMKAATGEFISFVDPDDWVHPQYFEILVKSIIQKDADVSTCYFERVYEEKYSYSEQHYIKGQNISVDQFFRDRELRYPVVAKLFRRDIIQNHQFVTGMAIGEDVAFNLDIFCHTPNLKIYHVPEKLYYYFMREGSASHSMERGSTILMSKWYAEHIDTEEITGFEYILLEQAIKKALSARYVEMFSLDADKYQKEANGLLRLFVPRLIKSQYAPLKDKITLSIMTIFPFLYRIFRWIDDPTMRDWERKSKEKRRSELNK